MTWAVGFCTSTSYCICKNKFIKKNTQDNLLSQLLVPFEVEHRIYLLSHKEMYFVFSRLLLKGTPPFKNRLHLVNDSPA